MLCNKCGFQNPVGMNFCGQCAESLQLRCSKCDSDNPSNFKFCGKCGNNLLSQTNPSPLSPTTQRTSATVATSEVVAERRQLTVLFCDLVGSSTLSESVDPEELREIMHKYRAMCDHIVCQHNGFTAQYLGDGILVYFGYPRANEDDVRRAVNTGLELVRCIEELNYGLANDHDVSLAIRIGIHTGLVVVGDLAGNNQNSLALGTTPNIAARLQDLASPNSVVVSEASYKLIPNLFEFKSLGNHELKGFSRPMSIHQATRALDVNRGHSNSNQGSLLPLIGREQESALLTDRIEQAKAGVGQVVLLSGEAGIGKSRLAQFAREQVAHCPHFLVEGWGTPQFKNSYLHCVIAALRRHLNLDEITGNNEKIECLESLLADFCIPTITALPLFADLLGIDIRDTNYQSLHLSPQEHKQRTLEVILSLLTAISSHKLIVVIIEDLHWIDPTTLELITSLLDQVPTTRVITLLTYRMEFVPPWQPRSHLTQVSINRLTREQSEKMIHWMCGSKKLPHEVFKQIVEKTDGIPFYIEELTHMVLDSNLLIEGEEKFELSGPLSSLAIPTTLQDSLMAKLDKLGPEKELAQISAIVGREFKHDVLQAVVQHNADNLKSKLAILVLAELLYQRGLPPHASYMFRHALVHEAAYQSLLKKTRQKYHLQIANILVDQFHDIVVESPEIIAHHFSCAGSHSAAIQYWLAAGDNALKHSAIIDAIIHLNKGLESFHQLSTGDQNPFHELNIQAKLGKAYIMTRGYGANEVENCFSRAFALSRNISDSEKTFPIVFGLWEYYLVRAELDTANDLALVLIKSSENSDNQRLSLEAHRALGSTLFWRGDFSAAKNLLAQGIAIKPSKVVPAAAMTPIQDPTVAGLANTACILWLTGFADQALDFSKQAIAVAESIAHPFSIAYAYMFCAFVHQLRGDSSGVIDATTKGLAVADRYNFLFWQTSAKMLQIWAYHQKNHDPLNIKLFEEAMKFYNTTGARLALSYFQALLSDLHLSINNASYALNVINESVESANKRGERYFLAELMRIKAQTLVRSDIENATQAIELLKEAQKITKEQNARGIELRIAITMENIHEMAGTTNDQPELIESILSTMDEGKDCPDWIMANKLIKKPENTLSEKTPA